MSCQKPADWQKKKKKEIVGYQMNERSGKMGAEGRRGKDFLGKQ